MYAQMLSTLPLLTFPLLFVCHVQSYALPEELLERQIEQVSTEGGDDVGMLNLTAVGGHASGELDPAFVAHPETVPAAEHEDGGTLITLPFNLTLERIGDATEGDTANLKKRYGSRPANTIDMKNGTIEQGKRGYAMLATYMDMAKATTFLTAAKEFANSQSASDDRTTFTYTNSDFSLVMFLYDKVPRLRPGWYIYYDVVSAIQSYISHCQDNTHSIKGWVSDEATNPDSANNPTGAIIDFALVPSFGDVAAPAGGGRRKRHSDLFERHDPGSLVPTEESSSSSLEKRDGTWLQLANGVTAQVLPCSVQVGRGLMMSLAKQLYSSLERDALRATIYYRQAIAHPAPDPTLWAGTELAVAGATATIHILAANGQQFDWGFLINFVGGLRNRGLRAHWDRDAGDVAAVGGLIVKGATILGAWAWGTDVHSFLQLVGEQAFNQVACTFGTITGTSYTCFNRIEL